MITIAYPIAAAPAIAAAPSPGGQSLQMRRAAYIAHLLRADWSFEHAEGQAYRSGKAELLALQNLQLELDPSGALWTRHGRCDKPMSRVRVALEHADGARRTTWVFTTACLTDVARFHSMRNERGTRVDVEYVNPRQEGA